MTRFPGESEERTAIAWGRTALAAAGLGVLLLRLALDRDSIAEFVGAALALLAGAGFAWRGRSSYRSPVASVTALRLLTGALAGSGLATCIALL
ncbi:MAG TPA: DUF202 domain-containing protein [Jatrophihabitantaceae bacterium]